MKALYELNNIDKQNYFNLLVYALMDEIKYKADEWFEDAFKGSFKYPKELCIDNLKADLDYIFSEAIWIIELGESQGFNMDEPKKRLQFHYERYTREEHGYRFLVNNPYYDAYQNKLLTEEEVKERGEKMCDEISALIQEMEENGVFNILKKNIE